MNEQHRQPSAPPTLSVIVPAYNEAPTIAEMVRRLDDELVGAGLPFEIIVVADGCTDRTPQIVRDLRIPHVQVVDYDLNQGKGFAVRTGAAKALGAVIGFIDGDLDIHPSGLVRLIEQLNGSGADAVIGSKLHPDSAVQYPIFRRVQSHVFRMLARLLFALDISDSQTGLKVFRAPVLRECLPKVASTGFAFDLELLVIANDAGYRIEEGPVQLDYQFSTTTGASAVVAMLGDLGRIYWRRTRRTTERPVILVDGDGQGASPGSAAPAPPPAVGQPSYTKPGQNSSPTNSR